MKNTLDGKDFRKPDKIEEFSVRYKLPKLTLEEVIINAYKRIYEAWDKYGIKK